MILKKYAYGMKDQLVIIIYDNIQIIVTIKRNEHYLDLESFVVYLDVVVYKLEIKKV